MENLKQKIMTFLTKNFEEVISLAIMIICMTCCYLIIIRGL